MNALLTTTALLLLPTQEASFRAWEVDGVKRQALVCEPSKKSAARIPLVFDFHGHGGTARHAVRTYA